MTVPRSHPVARIFSAGLRAAFFNALLLVSCIGPGAGMLSGQHVMAAQDAPALPNDLVSDIHDDAVVQALLLREVNVPVVYKSPYMWELIEKQAEDLLTAANRRVARQEKFVDELRKGVAAGTTTNDEYRKALTELQTRIEAAYTAIARSAALRQIVASARQMAKRSGKLNGKPQVVKFRGTGYFSEVDRSIVGKAFERRWRRPLPVSAEGGSATHRAMGFDHHGRVDVALTPDQPEGMWLCQYLRTLGIPFYAFRSAMAGKATGAHIHIGPPSERHSPIGGGHSRQGASSRIARGLAAGS